MIWTNFKQERKAFQVGEIILILRDFWTFGNWVLIIYMYVWNENLIYPIIQILITILFNPCDHPYYTYDHPTNSKDNQFDNPEDNFNHPDIYPDILCKHLNDSKDSPDHP